MGRDLVRELMCAVYRMIVIDLVGLHRYRELLSAAECLESVFFFFLLGERENPTVPICHLIYVYKSRPADYI